ncbi:hypothetical protein [Thiolinea disciformis]|uniref:hypothetical protein n=1 Tax=Thiolinea disciformis TaxID=125614 RepID=UPI00036AC5A1|nr:hypothetical protein [Thiolinea disciformis]
MRVMEGALQGSQVTVSKPQNVLQIHARLMVAKSYRLPQDMRAIELVEKREYHPFWLKVVMALLVLTIVGILIAILIYKFAKRIQFKIRFQPKHEPAFIVEGNEYQHWKELKRFVL